MRFLLIIAIVFLFNSLAISQITNYNTGNKTQIIRQNSFLHFDKIR